MKTIQYECRPGQIRSRVYDVILFYNDDNWNVIKNAYALHYDPLFWDYNKYIFFPVQREKWATPSDAPQNLRTLVASADVLLRAMPSSADNDLFIAGFFENPNDFESVKRELREFVELAYNISAKNYYIYLGEQIRYGNKDIWHVFDKEQKIKVNEYVERIKSGDISFEFAGEQIDRTTVGGQELELFLTVLKTIGKEQIDELLLGVGDASSLIRKDIKVLLKDFDFGSDSYAPKFQVVIYEKRKMEKGVSGKYDIYLKRNGVMDDQELYFSTKHAKALYIYFLIHASEKMIKDDIDREELREIYYKLYNVKDEIDARLADGRNSKNELLFDVFIKDTKPSVNRTVLAALKGVYDHKKMKSDENKNKPFRDAEKWYTIQVDDDKHYFVELPKDCVEIPESLLIV